MISLFGGVPGGISIWKAYNEKPKLNFKLQGLYSGNLSDNRLDSADFVVLILSIGNEGDVNFKRFGSPILEYWYDGKWVGLRAGNLPIEYIKQMPHENVRNMLTAVDRFDYMSDNRVIPPNENIDIFLFFIADQFYIHDSHGETIKGNFRLTLFDVKNREYTKEFNPSTI